MAGMSFPAALFSRGGRPRSKPLQLIRSLPYGFIFLVFGQDKLSGAKDFEHGVVLAFLQIDEGSSESFPVRLRHIRARNVNIGDKGHGSMEDADFLAVQFPRPNQCSEDRFEIGRASYRK